MDRALRRHHEQRIRAKALRTMRTAWLTWRHVAPPAGMVSRMASVHCVPCSCWMCAHRETYKDRRAELRGT
jgi:hypothetical protein